MLAWELKSFIDFDLDDHKVRVGRKVYDVDILVPKLRLIVEFDGAYWHRDTYDRDRTKSERLMRAGWRVIRVREEPLELTGVNDVIVPQQDHKTVANRVLTRIETICEISLQGLHDYLACDVLLNADQAEAYILTLLQAKSTEQQKGPMKDPQLSFW